MTQGTAKMLKTSYEYLEHNNQRDNATLIKLTSLTFWHRSFTLKF